MRRSTFIFSMAIAALGASSAWAASWTDYSSAFPLYPCQDGWMGCIVDAQIINPDMGKDSTGVPVPAGLRVGWFDLQPTAAFAPFVGLSQYPETVAELPPPDEPIDVPPPEPVVVVNVDEAAAAARAESEAGALKEAEEARKRAEADSRELEERLTRERADAEAKAKAEQEAAARKAEDEARKKAEASGMAAAEAEAQAKAEAERARKEAEERAAREREEREAHEAQQRAEAEGKAKAEEEARQKAAEEAAAKAEDEARQKAEAEAAAAEEARKKAEAEAAAKAAAEAEAKKNEPPPPPEPVDESCDNLIRLEPAAMLGKLNKGQEVCLEESLKTAAKQTEKEKISLLLMSNAYSKGDKPSWEKLVARHLDEIDQSNPDLCYKYALHLSRKGASKSYAVIRWADVALENRTVWTGDTYTSRVYSLYKLKAASAQRLWQAAEKTHANSPTDQTKTKVTESRDMTKVYSREWYEYAKVAGKDTNTALQLCMSAAGTKEYCEPN
ncbi:MAG: hypothetical protein HN348_02935 [Proteobacteria bacterium]|jgi:DNA segregation ATPase FtsK/SpoIIIE-like protein|nr:hypothetical protein [Pseudomonadota bacterium]